MTQSDPRSPSPFIDETNRETTPTPEELKRRARQEANSAKEKALTQTDRAKRGLQRGAEDAKQRSREYAAQSKDRMAEHARHLAGAFERTSETLRDEGEQALSRYSASVGQGVRAAADYVGNHELREIVHDVEDVARRSPALFVGGAFIVGLAIGRFLKASARNEEHEPTGSRNPYVGGEGYTPREEGFGRLPHQGYGQTPSAGGQGNAARQ